MPRIVPLPGATTVSRVKENSKLVPLNAEEMKSIDEILANVPVKGQRWPDMLQQFEDS